MDKKSYMGKWELGCIVFNSLVYKIFSGTTEGFAKNGGSAAWITALFSGLVFLALLFIILKLYSPYADRGLVEVIRTKFGKAASGFVSVLFIIYFLFGIYFASISVYSALKTVAYVKSPIWFILLFFAIGSIVTVLCGERAVRRMHSLYALGVGAAVIAVVLLGLRYADVYNIFPILGKGATSVFGKGLSTLFIYSDIIVIFLLPKKEGKYAFKKTVMTSATLAVLVNVAAVTALSLNFSYELIDKLLIPLYPLTKAANLGKFPARLDFAYQAALITSTFLYLSLALSSIIKCVKEVRVKPRSVGVAALCVMLCFTLCGCYDSKEVEEKAYVIALGIDKGENAKYKYTFQLSNPLESGGSIGAEKKAGEESGGEEGNKTVDNIITEADDYYLATNKLKSLISKEPDISHIKVIVFSYDIARESALEHSELLMREREIRPGTNVCLSESAESFLTSVKPTLEESTVRYYELFFRNDDVPFAPVTELRDFVGRSRNAAYDAVVPDVDENGLNGMGIFSNGELKDIRNGDDVLIYKMLCGELKFASVGGEDKSAVISSDGKTMVDVRLENGIPIVNIEVQTKVDMQNEDFNPEPYLAEKGQSFLNEVYSQDCDILGIGRRLRKNYATISEWEKLDWDSIKRKTTFSLKIRTNKGKINQNIQNN